MDKEEILVKKILENNERAVNQFYNKYKPPLYSFIRKRVSDNQDIEDILQQTLFAALNSLPNFRFRSSLFSWLCAIAHHEIVDFYRKKKLKTILFSKIPFLKEAVDKALKPEERYLRYELQKEIKNVFSQLSEGYSKILRLKYIEEFSMKEIAQRLKTTIKAVESRLTRARKKFKTIWQENH